MPRLSNVLQVTAIPPRICWLRRDSPEKKQAPDNPDRLRILKPEAPDRKEVGLKISDTGCKVRKGNLIRRF